MSGPLSALARELPRVFRENAAEVRRLSGSDGASAIWEEAARIAEVSIRDVLLAPLALDQAATESGLTVGHLRRLIRSGKLPNSGSESDPRILRKHLPSKPGHEVDATFATPACSPMQAARADMHGDA